MKHKSSRSGFTIIELIVTIVVIAILASITLVSYSYLQKRAADTATSANVKQYVEALDMYAFEHGRYPEGSSCLGTKPAGVDACGGLQYVGSGCAAYGAQDGVLVGIEWNDSFTNALSKYMGEGVKEPQYYPYKVLAGSVENCSLYSVANYPMYQSYTYLKMGSNGIPRGTYSSADTNYFAYMITYALSGNGSECRLDNSVKDGDTCIVWAGKFRN